MAPPTVYRALDFLLEQGLIHKLESLHAFVGCDHPEHPHSSEFLICVDCGEVAELEDAAVDRSLASVAPGERLSDPAAGGRGHGDLRPVHPQGGVRFGAA